MSRYDEPGEDFGGYVEDDPEYRYEAITQEYRDRVTSELKVNIREFLDFASMRSLIKLIVESA